MRFIEILKAVFHLFWTSFLTLILFALPIATALDTTITNNLIIIIAFAVLGYLGSLFILWLLKKTLPKGKEKAQLYKDKIISMKGFVNTFPFYLLTVTLIFKSYNLPNSGIGIAIGAGALIIYYQYIIGYVSEIV